MFEFVGSYPRVLADVLPVSFPPELFLQWRIEALVAAVVALTLGFRGIHGPCKPFRVAERVYTRVQALEGHGSRVGPHFPGMVIE